MKLGWGWKIGILYGCFVVFMSTLVIASNHQHFDLVSKDYYEQEIGYQKVIEAGKNQCSLSAPFCVHANEKSVIIDFPPEFKNMTLSGTVKFYSPVNSAWDRDFPIKAENNSFMVSRELLNNTRYTVKMNCIVGGKSYYQESEISLHI